MRVAFGCVMSTVMLAGCGSAPANGAPFEPVAAASAGAAAPAVVAAPALPAAAAPSAAVSSKAPNPSGCPTRFTIAARASMDMSWPDTVGYLGGRGMLQAWSKITHTLSDGGSSWESTPCGVSLPDVITSPLLDGIELSNEIPVATFDLPSMPRASGKATWASGSYTMESLTVLGAMLLDPSGPWPTRRALMPADHDGDGKVGITAIPRTGGVFGLPPTDIGQTQHADQIFIASRIVLRMSAPSTSCSVPSEGSIEPLGFDYTIIGCHAQGRDDCKESEVNLLSNNSPTFMLGTRGTWSLRPIAEAASCAQVVAALPAL
jgi:hypothetical protein